MSDQSAGGVLALQQIQSLCANARLKISITVLEAQQLIGRRLVVIPKNAVSSLALTDDPMLSTLRKNRCKKVDKLHA